MRWNPLVSSIRVKSSIRWRRGVTAIIVLMRRPGYRLWRGHRCRGHRRRHRRMLERRVRMRLVMVSWSASASLPLQALFKVYFCVPFLFIGTCEFTTTDIACEWLFSSVCPYVRCQMIWSTERAHTNTALKWFLTCVNTNVPCQFVWSRKPAIAPIYWTGIGAFVDGRFARAIRIFAWFNSNEPKWLRTLLINLW